MRFMSLSNATEMASLAWAAVQSNGGACRPPLRGKPSSLQSHMTQRIFVVKFSNTPACLAQMESLRGATKGEPQVVLGGRCDAINSESGSPHLPDKRTLRGHHGIDEIDPERTSAASPQS
jgi:hypothetical protein